MIAGWNSPENPRRFTLHRFQRSTTEITIIGSANLDDRSFFINDEVNLYVDSEVFAQE